MSPAATTADAFQAAVAPTAQALDVVLTHVDGLRLAQAQGDSGVAAGERARMAKMDSSTPYGMRRIAYTVANGQLQRASVVSSDTDGYPWVIGALPAYTKTLGSVVNTTNVFTYQDGRVMQPENVTRRF